MSQPPTLNGQVIGQTERATRAVLDALLAGTGTSFETWVTLNLVAVDGEVVVGQLLEQLVTGLRISPVDAGAAIDDVRRDALVTGTDTLRLTEDGRHRYEQIRDGIDDIAQRLYGDLPHDDLVTARRVLETVTERARAELATR